MRKLNRFHLRSQFAHRAAQRHTQKGAKTHTGLKEEKHRKSKW